MRYDYIRTTYKEKHLEKMQKEYLPKYFGWVYNASNIDTLLLLIVLVEFVSKEEIVNYWGISYAYCEKLFLQLRKEEFIKSIPLKGQLNKHISRTDTLYTYTKKGYDFATQVIDGGDKKINPYKPKKETVKHLHDYINGMNFFGCLIGLQGEDFGWLLEKVYGDYRKNNNTFAEDSEILLGNIRIHIEQDLGTESNYKLLNKLFEYQRFPNRDHPILSSDEDVVLISFYKPLYMKEPAYQQVQVSNLAKEISDMDINCKLEAAVRDKNISKNMLETLRSLYKESDKISGDYGNLKVADMQKMNVKYCAENPFYQNAFNKKQYESFIKKRANLFQYLWVLDEYKDIRRDIYKGVPIYIAPTVLLERYIRYISRFSSYYDNLSKCLTSYFGELNFKYYSPRGQIEKNMVLRNQFSSKCGKIYVEYPTIDLGALMRIRYFLQQSSTLSSVNHLIILVDQPSEALKIAKWIKDFNRMWQQIDGFDVNGTYAGIYRDRSLNDIYYLKREDLEAGRPERLFYANGYQEVENNDGKMVGIGENEICYLYSESHPEVIKINNTPF